MFVKMKKTKDGSPNGIAVKTYEKDGTYQVSVSLGKSFIRQGVAEEVKAPAPEVVEKNEKAKGGAPKNKAAQPEKNKAKGGK